MSYFIVIFGGVIWVSVDTMKLPYATFAFVVGSFTSMVCGYIGMAIAVRANYRTTYLAITSLSEAFKLAFRAGCVMGFSSVGLGLGTLMALM